MPAYDFINEKRVARGRKPQSYYVPTDPKAIELRNKQYERLKKRAEWVDKLADTRKKLKDSNLKSDKTVKGMASNALKKRSIGIYGLREMRNVKDLI